MISKSLVNSFKYLSRLPQHPFSSYASFSSNSIRKLVPPYHFPGELEASQKPSEIFKHRIEIAKPSDANKILKFLEKNFFCHDPLCKSLNLCEKKLETPFEDYIKCILSQGMSLIAHENTRENQVLGICVNQKNCKWHGNLLEEYAEFTDDENFKKFLRIQALMSRAPAMHEFLSQLMIFNLAFLSSRKDHQNIAMELAEFSLNLARDMNFSFARFDCTNEESMKLARKLRGIELWKTNYKYVISAENKQPVVTPESPNTHAASYYINLKLMPVVETYVGRRFKPVSANDD